MSGAFAFPDDQTRLQGGKCAEDIQLWDALADAGGAIPFAKPSDAVQASWDQAKTLFCDVCPILQRCRAQTLKERLGVWGGLDQYERHRLRTTARRQVARERLTAVAVEEAPALDAAVEVLESARVADFPQEPPQGRDGWTRDRHIVQSAWYMAQTADGEFVRMKLKTRGAGIIRWFPAKDVDLRRPVAVVVEEWVGRPRKEKRAQSAEGVSAREVA